MKDEAEEKFNEYKERKFKRYRSKKELKEKLLPIFQERSIAKKANVKLESPKEADVWDFTLKLKHPEEYTRTAPTLTIEKGLSPETYADRIEKRLEEIRKKPKKKKKRKKRKKPKPKKKGIHEKVLSIASQTTVSKEKRERQITSL